MWDLLVFLFGRGGCYELVTFRFLDLGLCEFVGCYEVVSFQLLSAVVVYHGYVGCGGMAVDFDDLFCMTLIPPRGALRLFAPSCALRPCAHSRC